MSDSVMHCEWKDYKVIATDQGMLANFQNNAQLIDWVNEQSLSQPVVCLGDGHDGIWNIISQIATARHRLEILDWYHLVENLHKVGGSIKRLNQAEERSQLSFQRFAFRLFVLSVSEE